MARRTNFKFVIQATGIVVDISLPVDFVPGSEAKIEVLSLRHKYRLPLHLDDDYREFSPIFQMNRETYNLSELPDMRSRGGFSEYDPSTEEVFAD